MREAVWRVGKNSQYYFCNFSIIANLLQNKVYLFLKKMGKESEQTLHQRRYIRIANKLLKRCSTSLVIREM